MLTQVIRQQIASARLHPNGADVLRRRLEELSELSDVDRSALDRLVEHIGVYIGETPDLIDACNDAAIEADIEPLVGPILQVAARYFVTPIDFIPDRAGLFGLLDDAYLSRSLIEKVSTLFAAHTGTPLLPFDLAAANAMVRTIIGEPVATQLDEAVATTLGSAAIKAQIAKLSARKRPITVVESAAENGLDSWGGTWEDEMARLGSACGISVES